MRKTKESLYQGIIDIYKKTGQGVPSFLLTEDNQIVQELIDENKIKRVKIEFSYLPNDEFLCLTKGFCPEECGKNTQGLTFMRIYLGIKELGLGVKASDVLNDKEAKKIYENWVVENKEKLKETDEILAGKLDVDFSKKSTAKKSVKTKPVLSENEIEFIKAKNFYKENKTVKQVNEKVTDLINVTEELISKLKQIINLIESSGVKEKYKEKLIEHNENLKKELVEFDMLNNISIWLCNITNEKAKIQSILK